MAIDRDQLYTDILDRLRVKYPEINQALVAQNPGYASQVDSTLRLIAEIAGPIADQIEANEQPGQATSWLTGGNAGADKVIGTVGPDGWDQIVNNIKRGGFKATGERTLNTHGTATYPHSQFVEKTIVAKTIGTNPFELFNFAIPSDSNFKFTAEVQSRKSDGSSRAAWERKVMAWRTGVGSAQKGLVHTVYTDTMDGMDVYWEVVSGTIRLMAKGLSTGTVFWSGIIKYQGISQE